MNLTLLDGVCWNGIPVVGDRQQALLAALAAAGGRVVPAERLAALVWHGEATANAAKNLQVVVSRARAVLGAGAVVRDGAGYRLDLPIGQVDSCLLARLAAQAAQLLVGDPLAAAQAAREALVLGAPDSLAGALPGLAGALPGEEGPLAELRRAAARDLAAARAVLAQACSRTGAHAEALPLLTEAVAGRPDDEGLLADLLRSEAAVRGPGAALERYERYRRDLRDRVGVSPGDALARVHRDLLAADRPVRDGLRYDATRLLGRGRDVERLRAMLASSRVVSIIGPGGLGKTRLAHLLARDSPLPVVRVVELVGVTASADLLGEVGSALGVRDSVGNRRVLTPEQHADLRGRIAAQLAGGPSLLVLDNCEHLVGAVAELVAFLVATTADLRVLTTSRAPLSISAERVYPLGTLSRADAVELFRERAVAARPDVRLGDAAVASIVDRLDGLPLAVELAAARVRVMSVEEIDLRLADRFVLLRGGDRGAPDRHRTLLAVIDWSWNLLAEPERRALRWLSVFRDGLTLRTAEEMLGPELDPVEVVQNLIDQSLLSVREVSGRARYQMLETVREFGLLRLAETGETAAARRARRAWALRYVSRHCADLYGERQFTAIDALAAEEANLADELRAALAEGAAGAEGAGGAEGAEGAEGAGGAGGDAEAAVSIVAVLAGFWEMRGEHTRILVLIGAISAAVRGWEPPPRAVPAALAAALAVLSCALPLTGADVAPLRDLLVRFGPDAAEDPRVAGGVRVLLSAHPAHCAPESPQQVLERLAEDTDRYCALMALTWLLHLYENSGDTRTAMATGERALALIRPGDGPWLEAGLRTQLASLTMRVGQTAASHGHIEAALPVLQRLGAHDDAAYLRTLQAADAIRRGALDDAEGMLAGLAESGDPYSYDAGSGVLLGGMMAAVVRAELATARGQTEDGLRRHLQVADQTRTLRMPGVEQTGLEPWLLFGEAVALAAFARHAVDAGQLAEGAGLASSCLLRSRRLLGLDEAHIDYPVFGTALFALGAWLLRVGPAGDQAADAAWLLAVARRFGYFALISPLDWHWVEAAAEQRAPGALARAEGQIGRRRSSELLGETDALVERLAGQAPPPAVLQAPAVADDRQRQEDDDHHQAGEQRPADLGGDRAVVRQVPGRGDEM